MSLLSKLFNSGSDKLSEAIKQNATIIDVRSPMEFGNGHVNGSQNIPLDQLQDMLTTLPGDQPIIFCCASGARSGVATKMATSHGLQAVNGGPWTNVFQRINTTRK